MLAHPEHSFLPVYCTSMSEKIIALLVSAIASGGFTPPLLLLAIPSALTPLPPAVLITLARPPTPPSPPHLLPGRDLDLVDRFVDRYGPIPVPIGRMLPIVRTFIAFPAGVAKMNQLRFHIYTFIGSWPWCYALAYVGMKLGATWNSDPRFKAIFHRFHLGVELVLLAGVLWFVISHWKNRIRTEPA